MVKPVRNKRIVCERSEHYEYLIPNLFRDLLQDRLIIIFDCTNEKGKKMLNPVQNISFNGIYDLVVPEGTSKDKIEAKTAQFQKVIRDNLGDKWYQVVAFDDRIRFVSTIDNPNVIVNLFEIIGGENLAKQYIRKNVQEYRLDLQA